MICQSNPHRPCTIRIDFLRRRCRRSHSSNDRLDLISRGDLKRERPVVLDRRPTVQTEARNAHHGKIQRSEQLLHSSTGCQKARNELHRQLNLGTSERRSLPLRKHCDRTRGKCGFWLSCRLAWLFHSADCPGRRIDSRFRIKHDFPDFLRAATRLANRPAQISASSRVRTSMIENPPMTAFVSGSGRQ